MLFSILGFIFSKFGTCGIDSRMDKKIIYHGMPSQRIIVLDGAAEVAATASDVVTMIGLVTVN